MAELKSPLEQKDTRQECTVLSCNNGEAMGSRVPTCHAHCYLTHGNTRKVDTAVRGQFVAERRQRSWVGYTISSQVEPYSDRRLTKSVGLERHEFSKGMWVGLKSSDQRAIDRKCKTPQLAAKLTSFRSFLLALSCNSVKLCTRQLALDHQSILVDEVRVPRSQAGAHHREGFFSGGIVLSQTNM